MRHVLGCLCVDCHASAHDTCTSEAVELRTRIASLESERVELHRLREGAAELALARARQVDDLERRAASLESERDAAEKLLVRLVGPLADGERLALYLDAEALVYRRSLHTTTPPAPESPPADCPYCIGKPHTGPCPPPKAPPRACETCGGRGRAWSGAGCMGWPPSSVACPSCNGTRQHPPTPRGTP